MLETDIPKFLSTYNSYIYILWLKLVIIDWTEKLYMIAISNQMEKFLSVQWGVSVAYMGGGGGGDSGYSPGLSLDGQSYSGMRGYSDMGGRVVIPGLFMDSHGYSGIRGYTSTDKDGGGKGRHS